MNRRKFIQLAALTAIPVPALADEILIYPLIRQPPDHRIRLTLSDGEVITPPREDVLVIWGDRENPGCEVAIGHNSDIKVYFVNEYFWDLTHRMNISANDVSHYPETISWAKA